MLHMITFLKSALTSFTQTGKDEKSQESLFPTLLKTAPEAYRRKRFDCCLVNSRNLGIMFFYQH